VVVALQSTISRRRLLRAAGSTVAMMVASPFVMTSRARAQRKKLKILQWKHFVPSYNEWFRNIYINEWKEKNDTDVVVDYAGISDIFSLAAAEVKERRGHDVVQLVTPASVVEEYVIDHREIYEECERRHGRIAEFALRTSYNPKTNKYFGFCGTWQPAVISYRKAMWDTVQAVPDTWERILSGGRQIKLLQDRPVGFSLNEEDNAESTMRTIMYCFGSSEQAADGTPALKSKATVDVIKYVKSLYEEAMTTEVLAWQPPSNNRFMLNGEGCLTLDTISIPRAADSMRLPLAHDLRLMPVPQGPAARLGPSFGFHPYVIWRFAENIEGAKRFLADYGADLRRAFLASGFQNMPAWPGAVPDLAELVANDATASTSDTYALLADAPVWTTNIGYPGYTNAAIGEALNRGLIPRMCARAATGKLSPEEALDEADRELRNIFEAWKAKGKV
jgi:multiple sugar transport system substrate-binding protein